MLIVKTQNRCSTLTIENYSLFIMYKANKKKMYRIVGWKAGDKKYIVLGKYRSKKRCLEVMAGMDNALAMQMSKCNTRVVDNNGNTIKNMLSNHFFLIYAMPEK